MKQLRSYYKKKFQSYPDLVTVLQFREMLGGIGDTFARKLIHEERVTAFFIRPYYYISKSSVIDYLLSADYAKRRLSVWV